MQTNSSTRWLPNGAIGHYRHIFTYDLLYAGQHDAGRTEEALNVETPDQQYQLRVLWQGDTPHFLPPPGYLSLDWARPVIERRTDMALVIAGAGTSKTSSVAIAMLPYCALIPSYSFMNGAPTDEQSQLMIDEMEKWLANTAFRKFVIPTNRGEGRRKAARRGSRKPISRVDFLLLVAAQSSAEVAELAQAHGLNGNDDARLALRARYPSSNIPKAS